ncbi:hypothetical protein GCM10025862_32820 [Arsenicicoccus piscis]|uniref:Uncharacterized protein n=1 Tax=Arsenicicoccus piscis TaxID=673954 RepID=A0ABQ6HS96_9MICO|nr:hypothetical protein GCM10025862_32820 [Arsenicicoccus piscis]
MVTAVGSEVDDVVGGCDDVEVVLDDDDGAAAVDEVVEQVNEPAGIDRVQAGGGFVQDDDLGTGRELPGQLEALSFPAGQGGEVLAEGHVAEPDLCGRGEQAGEAGVGQVVVCLVDGQLEDVRDGQPVHCVS